MSLDVYLQDKTRIEPCRCACGHEHERQQTDVLYDDNITHNLNTMADAAGLYQALWRPEDINITTAAQLIAPLQRGLAELETNPDRYRALNPANGWGNYAGLVRFVRAYLMACQAHPDATVRASR